MDAKYYAAVRGSLKHYPRAMGQRLKTWGMQIRCDTSTKQIAIWASVGFLVAGGWAVYAFETAPLALRDVWTLVSITCPVAIAGMHFPISVYATLVANAATYALAGLLVEMVRGRRQSARA